MSRTMSGINATGDALLAGGTATAPQTFTGFNQFDELTKFEITRPQYTPATPTTNPTANEFVTKADGVDLFGSITNNAQLDGGESGGGVEEPQIFTGFNEFENTTTFTNTIRVNEGDGANDDPEILMTAPAGYANLIQQSSTRLSGVGSSNRILQSANQTNEITQISTGNFINKINQYGTNSTFITDGTIENTRVKLTANGFWGVIKVKTGSSTISRLYFEPDDATKPLYLFANHFIGATNTSTGDTQVGGYLRPYGNNYLKWNSNPQTGGGNGRHYWRFNWYNGSASQVDFVNLSGDNNCLIRARQYSNISDDRVKTNETPIENAMATLKKLNPVTYDYYGNLDCSGVSQFSAGLVAQEIWYKCPELRFIISTASDASLNHTDISNDDWGTEAAGVNYTEIQPYMIKVIQDHQTTIEKLEERLSILEAKINNSD